MNFGDYDVVILGGGIAGATAAWTLAEHDLRIIVIEPTGTLGREIVREREMFVDLPSIAERSDFAAALLSGLVQRRGWFDGAVDTNCAAAVFDDLLARRGTEVIFHVWPTRIVQGSAAVSAVEVAGQFGYGVISTQSAVDASRHGRISRGYLPEAPCVPSRSSIVVLFSGVEQSLTADSTKISVLDFGVVELSWRPTFWPGEYRVTLALDRRLPPRDVPLLVSAAIRPIQDAVPALAAGALSYVAEDAIESPRYRMSATAPVIAGLYPAGPWMDTINAHGEVERIPRLISLGEHTARAVLERSIDVHTMGRR